MYTTFQLSPTMLGFVWNHPTTTTLDNVHALFDDHGRGHAATILVTSPSFVEDVRTIRSKLGPTAGLLMVGLLPQSSGDPLLRTIQDHNCAFVHCDPQATAPPKQMVEWLASRLQPAKVAVLAPDRPEPEGRCVVA